MVGPFQRHKMVVNGIPAGEEREGRTEEICQVTIGKNFPNHRSITGVCSGIYYYVKFLSLKIFLIFETRMIIVVLYTW